MVLNAKGAQPSFKTRPAEGGEDVETMTAGPEDPPVAAHLSLERAQVTQGDRPYGR